MKKSNKLLLGGFLTVILVLAGIHIALFAKYKNGNYTIYHPEDIRAGDKMRQFSNVSLVIIRNVRSATVQFGDMAAVEKGKEDIIKYEQKGDSLIITGHYFNDDQPDERRLVNFTLPYNVSLSAVNSFLYFEKGERTGSINPVMNLQNSRAIFSEQEAPLQLGAVKVVALDSSVAGFHGNIHINQLDVKLSNSALEYNEGEVGELSIVTDSVSRLSLQSKHLIKAKIISIPPNNP